MSLRMALARRLLRRFHIATANSAAAKSARFIAAPLSQADRLVQSRPSSRPNLLNLKFSAGIVSELRT
jgi:hypothetical protein